MAKGDVVGRSERLNTMTEAEILQEVLAGQRDAFSELFSRYRGLAFSLAFQYVRNHEDAKDVVQDAFIKVYQNIGKFNVQKRFSPWLLTIVRNLSIDFIRRRKRISDDGLPEVLPDHMARKGPEARVLGSELWAAMNQLNPNQREIIFLKDYQGHSYLEIAEILDIPLGTVMSRLHHARKRLIGILKFDEL